MRTARRLAVVDKIASEEKTSFMQRAYVAALKAFIALVLVTAFAVWGSFHVVAWWYLMTSKASELKAAMVQKFTRVEVRRELVKPETVPLPQLTGAISRKYRVPTVVLQAVVDQESGGGNYLYRFEAEKYSQMKQKPHVPDSEVRMLASSHGLAHVMGFNSEPRCGVHWSKLYDPYVGLDCGAKILRENIDKHNGIKDTSRRIWMALRDYNGSGKAAEQYANSVMARIGELLLRGLKEEI